jgi:hypothetical protein
MNAPARILFSALLVCLLGALTPRIAHSQVAVTSANPPTAPQGTLSLDVTVSGSGFDSSAQVEFLLTGTTNPGGVTVRKVKVTGPKKLVATIDVAENAVIDKFDIQVSLSGGRKGKGTSLFAVVAKVSNDPCATLGIDFPAFTFRGTTEATEEVIYVADSTGTCVREIGKFTVAATDASTTVFSYPVSGTPNVGRVAWSEGGQYIYAVTFTVTGTSIAVGAEELIYDDRLLASIDLSPDGSTVYATLDAVGSTDSSMIKAINFSDRSQRVVLVGPPNSADFDQITVDEDGTLFLLQRSPGPEFPELLLRIDPECADMSCATVLVDSNLFGIGRMGSVVASLVDDRLAYSYETGGNNCELLQVIADTGGPILNSAQPRYGERSTWYNGMILTNGRGAPTNGGLCKLIGRITQIDPDTSAETRLMRGNDPDGR